MPSQTNMNLEQKITQNPIINKVLVVVSVLFILALVFIFAGSITRKIRSPLTVPVLPSVTPTISAEPLNYNNPFTPDQGLVFNWGRIVPNLPINIDTLRINNPLITLQSLNSVSSRLGFSNQDFSNLSNDTSVIYSNNSANLIGSITENDLTYRSKTAVPIHTNTYTKAQAIEIGKNFISSVFGGNILNTLDPNPEVRFLSINLSVEEEPRQTTPEIANLISINFQQNINNLPLINPSRKGETFSLTIDTTGNLYLLTVKGGYFSYNTGNQLEVPTYAQLQKFASANATRISYSEDLDAEAVYSRAATVNVEVKEVKVGYFQKNNNDLIPVFIIEGVMSTSGIAPYPAIYVVPISGSKL